MDPYKRAKRQAEFKRLDAYLERLYREHRLRFNLLGFGAAVLICAVAYLLMEFLHWIFTYVSKSL